MRSSNAGVTSGIHHIFFPPRLQVMTEQCLPYRLTSHRLASMEPYALPEHREFPVVVPVGGLAGRFVGQLDGRDPPQKRSDQKRHVRPLWHLANQKALLYKRTVIALGRN